MQSKDNSVLSIQEQALISLEDELYTYYVGRWAGDDATPFIAVNTMHRYRRCVTRYAAAVAAIYFFF